jgi:hypothetical protein
VNDKDYRKMLPLDHFLGDEIGVSDVSNWHPKEQTILCYILATSMLDLYPGSWALPFLSSHTVFFMLDCSRSPRITFPYISVNLQSQNTVADSSQEPIQSNPAVLALGIILLEIITGKKFEKSADTSWNRSQALRELTNLQKQERNYKKRRVPTRLCEVLRACLQPAPPPTFPINDIRGERPTRHYILNCVVGPLAFELEQLFDVNLENLQSTLLPENEAHLAAKPDGLKGSSLASHVFDETTVETNNFSMS